MAAVDVSLVVSAIDNVCTAIGFIVCALLALSVSVFGLNKVLDYVSRKAGIGGYNPDIHQGNREDYYDENGKFLG